MKGGYVQSATRKYPRIPDISHMVHLKSVMKSVCLAIN